MRVRTFDPTSLIAGLGALVFVVVTTRETFEKIRKRQMCALQPRVLVDTIATINSPTLGDVMSCLDGGGYQLDHTDPMTIGDLLGRCGGPRLVEVLEDRGLPLDSPLDVADETHIALPLDQLLAASNCGANGNE